MDNAAIIFDNVRFCYGEVCAVNSVSFSLPEKKLTVLVGPNGGGKSTLVRLITGLVRPEEGSIVIRSEIEAAYVPQNFLFDISFPMTVGELVLQGTLSKNIKPFGKYTSAQKEKASSAVIKLGLGGYEDRSISQLSGGQLRRAVIARAVASDADLIALDEPDASLDVKAAKELYEILYSLKQEKTMVLASHNVGVVLDIADRAIYVNKTTLEYDTPQALKEALKGGILL